MNEYKNRIPLNYLNNMINLSRPSILLVFILYLNLSWTEIISSNFFNFSLLICFSGTLFLFDIFLFLLEKQYLKFELLINTIFFTLSTIFFLGALMISPTLNWLNKSFDGSIFRNRILLFIILTILILIQILIKKKFYTITNAFFIILIFISLFNRIFNLQKHEKFSIEKINSTPVTFDFRDNSNVKPVILFISDEFASPDELLNINSTDSTLKLFQNNLMKSGWNVNSSFYSKETSTIHSLASIFNFNLSNNSIYSNQEINTVAKEKLLKCAFYDSLKNQKIKVFNYGIFDLGDIQPFTRLYYYPKNFWEQLLVNSILPLILNSNWNFFSNKMNISPIEQHNKFILENLIKNLSKIHETKCFIYIHLFMPHSPYSFNKGFPKKELSTSNYINYWKFSSKMIQPILEKLALSNKYKIVFTGDHGFRLDKKINPHKTLTAFYGFNNKQLKNLNSVQDIGSLMWENLKEN